MTHSRPFCSSSSSGKETSNKLKATPGSSQLFIFFSGASLGTHSALSRSLGVGGEVALRRVSRGFGNQRGISSGLLGDSAPSADHRLSRSSGGAGLLAAW